MGTLRRACLLAFGLLALTAGPASAAQTAALRMVAADRLSTTAPVARACFERPLAGSADGVDVRRLTVPATGFLDARLDGSPTGADWDLAVFNAASGRLLGASSAFGGNEVVRAAVTAGDPLVVQACRYGGDGPPPALSVSDVVVSGPIPPPEIQSLVSIRFRDRADIERLQALDIDLAETGRNHRIDAVLHGADDATRLEAAGFDFTTRIADLAAYDRRTLRRDATRAATVSGLPSGRTTYRHLEDYEQELKDLVAKHPGLIRPVILPKQSVEGRTIQGIEIAEGVERVDDGRPTHVEMGLHHVREWQSGEMVSEFALTLADGYGKDARITKLLRETRTFLFPVINPDGLVAAMAAGDYNPATDDSAEASLSLAASGSGSYRRKNCATDPESGTPPEAPCSLKAGVDLNRNYGAFWGGPGSGNQFADQTYRGPAPFSEPEAQAVHEWSSAHQVMVMNSNHSYAGDVLYQPGFSREDEPGFPKGTRVPYTDQMVAVASAMARAAGYVAMVSYELYDVTGATEDWNYFAQGAFGYTTEVGFDNFHPNYQDAVIDQYLGTRDGPLSQEAGRQPAPGGMREAMLIAGEAAANPAYHSIVRGHAPAGRRLRLAKTFSTTTSYVDGGDALLIPERLDSSLIVPGTGQYEWHVNPSTRPLELIAGRTEAWTMTCEDSAGTVLETRQIVVAIGQAVTADLACTGTGGGPQTSTASKVSGLRLIGGTRKARKATRGGRRLTLVLERTGPGPLTKVRATLRDIRGRLRAAGSRRSIATRAKVVLKSRKRRLRRGSYRLEVTALSPTRSRVRLVKRLRLRR